MAEEAPVPVVNGDHGLDMWQMRQALLSNSTKRRTAELHRIKDKLENGAIPLAQVPALLRSLFDTCPLYVDPRSRQAVESCLAAIASSPDARNSLPAFVKELEAETKKAAIAPGNAFVLLRWSSLLIQQSARDQTLWRLWGMRTVATLTNAMDILFSSKPRDSTTATALRVSRRAFRTVLKSEFGPDAMGACISTLAAKGPSPLPKNALPLGIIAACCSRLPDRTSVVADKKAEYYAFYLREFLGSKTVLPAYIANALRDFFSAYVTGEELKKELIPAVEKSLLRAPEVVLNDLVAPMIKALPPDLDLSDILASNLVKPLLSNIKSTKVETRDGALRTFCAVAARSRDGKLVGKTADEILTPLKTNKVTAAEQRVIHANMLAALHPSASLASSLPQGLAPVATKEANEPAASAEISCIAKYVNFALDQDVKLETATIDAFAKGLGEKNLPKRRLWALHLADAIWNVQPEAIGKQGTAAFLDASIVKLIDIFHEVNANPLPAVQSGQVSVAAAATAVLLARAPGMTPLKNAAAIKKAAVGDKVLTLDPKPSFLLNARVYTKLTSEDDLRWLLRAAIAAFPSLTIAKDGNRALAKAWAQTIIFLISSTAVAPRVRSDAAKALQGLYVANAEVVSDVVVDGLWQWCEDVELETKDSAAAASKTGRSELFRVVRALCLDSETATKVGTPNLQDVIEKQLRRLLVLCRPQLISKAPWIELCLKTGNDPGSLAEKSSTDCLASILAVTENPIWKPLPAFQLAACHAAADLAFVAPDVMTPLIVAQISLDLDPSQLDAIGPTEAAIHRTPEGTAFVDVLSTKSQAPQIDKKTKDYDTLKWEEELRASLAAKKGQTKKLTAEEQSKVNAQLKKESEIRKNVAEVDGKLRRGIGFISALSTGPPTKAEAWFGPSVKSLFDIIQAGAGLILGDAASLGYLQCSEKTSSRLGPLRPFVGVATLRGAGITMLPENLLAEPLGDLVTRLLYRLRFLGEQRPFDTVTLSYILGLVFLVLENGGIDRAAGEDADEQLILAIEFLSFHTETCSDIRLPRETLLATLISAMLKFTQHYKEIKDCFADLCRCLAPSMNKVETDTVVKGVIVSDSSVRNAVLQAISAELELTDRDFYEEIWLACHDDDEENANIAHEVWEENELKIVSESAAKCLPFLESKDAQLRRAAARAVASAVKENPTAFQDVLSQLQSSYVEAAKPKKPELDRYGMPVKKDLSDPWESRHGCALAFKELSPVFPDDQLAPFLNFLIEKGPLSDKSNQVRDAMVDAATCVVSIRGKSQVEALMRLCEERLSASSKSSEQDLVNEAVVILYGALARHLPKGDDRVPKVVNRLLATLSTPSESVQYAVAQCLPPLVQASADQASQYLKQLVEETLHAKEYAARRGAAYGLAGVVKGRGISLLKDTRLLSTLRSATENKKDAKERQGAFLAYELLSLLLGRIFEPYVIQIVPQLLSGFGDTTADVREACLDAAKTCFATLSSFGVKQVLPQLLEGLDESQWRSKKGACDSLGAMAYLDPQQLAVSLPEIIPPLTEVLNDSHKEVRASANRSLQRFGEVISNPEVKSQVNILLKALSDPTKFTDEALDALIKVNFVHYLDAPSLALVVRILERGLGDRSATKRKASQIIGSLAHLTERKDLIAHLPILVAGLKGAIVDPVPTTRATASKALGSTIEKLGEDALPDLIPSLMTTLKSDTGAGDRLGSAQALSEVLAGLGTSRLEESLPTILQNVGSNKPSVREGFMSLFIFLPACFGQSFANYLARIIPPILAGLADDVESIRETALRAGRLLVKNFASKSVDLLLPELERGLEDNSHRIRLSSVELVGDLLFNLTGISGKQEADEDEEGAAEAGASLLETLGEEKRNRVLSALYICRCDTSGLVRTSAMNVWKALVSSPRTLRELVPTLTQLLVRRLASPNMEQKVIAGNALGELIRKAGEGVLATLLPTLEDQLQTAVDLDSRQGVCIALRELITSATPESLVDYEKTLISVVRTALVDSSEDVREAAADAFDSLQKVLGKRAVDQVLPHLLQLLRNEDEAANALAALLTLLTEQTRASIILPNLLPTLLTNPVSAFNARALASLAEVASSAMTRRIPNILNTLMDNIVSCKDEALKNELNSAFDTILLSVDEYDGLNTMMSVMLALAKNDDHRRRAAADLHFATFFEKAEIDFSRYYPDVIRALLIAFDDSAPEVVKAAWTGLTQLMQRLKKEEMESLVVSTRNTLNQVGVAGHALPGFSLPKGVNAVLPIFLQGLMNGSAEQRIQAALGISDLIDRTSPDGLKLFVTQITGPLIRVVSERSTELKAAILLTLNNLLEKVPAFLKPFLPQLQRTFAKALADPSSEVLRSRAAKALGTLITMTPRVDPLIAELVTGSKTTTDAGVKNAMLKALFEVVSKAGAKMNGSSQNAILGLIDSDAGETDDALNITYAKLLGSLIAVIPAENTVGLIKSRVLNYNFTHSTILALNAVLLEAPDKLTSNLDEITRNVLVQGINHGQPFISDNAVLAAGKYLLTEMGNKTFEGTKPIIEALASVLPVGKPVDTRRLALVVIRTVSRSNNELIRPHLATLVPAIFKSVRDPVIPVKLSAESAFLAVLSVVEEESAVFDKYMAGAGSELDAGTKRSMSEYFKRIALKLSAQARERKEAEGGAGGLGLSSDEVEDEKEVWSVGKVDLGESFAEE